MNLELEKHCSDSDISTINKITDSKFDISPCTAKSNELLMIQQKLA